MSLMSVARPAARPARSSALKEAMAACSHAFAGVALMSGLINILYLTGSFYMLEVYDRVLPSRSVPTLVALSLLAVTLFAFQGVLDVIRSRIMIRVAATLDERLSGRVYDIVVLLPLRTKGQGDGLAPLRDLDQITAFQAAIGRARPRCLSGDPAAGARRNHHRELDHRRARAGAGGTGDRKLEAVRVGAPELAAPVGFPRRDGERPGADGASGAEIVFERGGRH